MASSGDQTLTWQVDGEPSTLNIVVRDSGDEFENFGAESFDKTVTPGNLNTYVNVGPDAAPNQGEIVFRGLDASVIGVPLTYTLNIELSEGRDGANFAIADQLPVGLSYVAGSFSSTLTTWDTNGMNRTEVALDGTSTPAAFDPTLLGDGLAGESFSGTIDLPTPSILKITYQAYIEDEASRVVVENKLLEEADGLRGNSGSFSHALTNSATFNGGNAQSATVNLTGVIPGPCAVGCAGAAFGKTGEGATVEVIADDTGTIVDEAGNPAPVPVTYTFDANLEQWNNSNSNYTLDRNVVISDTLVPQLTWDNPSDASFITVVATPGPGSTTPIAALTQVTCPVDTATNPLATAAQNFNGDSNIGTYCVDGQRLLINIGKHRDTDVSITVNTAVTGISAADSRIEDRIDTDVFDMSDLSMITVASTYAGVDVSSDVELRFENELLIIELADGSTLPADGTWVVTLGIPAYVIDGKQTLDITNYAALFGVGAQPEYWSEDSSRATSFGDELEARKHVFDRAQSDWTNVLVAAEDADGALIDDVYVYRLQLIAHGTFSGAILAVSDLLPDETQFLGFVDEADVATGGPVLPGTTLSLAHGIVAEFDDAIGAQGEITVRQATGSIPVGGEVTLFFAVQVDPDVPESFTNSVGGSNATIVPGTPSIDIEKWIDEGVSPEYDAQGRLLNDGFKGDYDAAPGKSLTAGKAETIRFTVSNDGPEALIDIEVSDQLDSGKGAITDLVCVFPDSTQGTSWAGQFAPGTQSECEGTLPALAAGDTHANTVSVTSVGVLSGIPVGDADEWHGNVPTPLAVTGGQVATGFAIAGGIGLLAGAALLLRSRRSRA